MSVPPSTAAIRGPFHNQSSPSAYATLSNNSSISQKNSNINVNVNELSNTHAPAKKDTQSVMQFNSRIMANQSQPLSLTSPLQTPAIRISDYSSNLNMTSMDDLLSLSNLDDSSSKVNLKYYNRALISYLSLQGLNMNPLKITAYQLREKNTAFSSSSNTPINSSIVNNTNVETYITGNGQILFLPFNSQKKKRRNNNGNNSSNIHDEYNDDDADNDNDNDNEDNEDNDNDNDIDNDNFAETENESNFGSLNEHFSNDHSIPNNTQNLNIPPGFSTNSISKDNGNGITYHTFGIILKINKTVNLNRTVKVNYHTHANVKWTASEFSKKESFDERYRTSNPINWNLDLQNPDCYIPFKDSNGLNPNDFNDSTTLNDSLESDSFSMDSVNNSKKSPDSKVSTEPTQKIRYFKPLAPNNYSSESKFLINDSLVEANLFSKNENSSDSFDAGYYIFLLPVVYPLNTCESIYAPNSNVSHDFSIQIQKGIVPVPNLQAPQSAFLSTSPSHQHRFEDPKFDLDSKNINILDNSDIINNNAMSSSVMSNSNFSPNSSKSSFFKKIGIRRNSSSSSKNKTIATSPKTTSISNVFDHNTQESRVRSNSGASFFNHQPQTIKNIVYNYNYQLPSVRLPPSDATSTLNKSIYVNKVWNKALNYELLLPKKYTQLSPPNELNVPPNNKFLRNNTFMLQMKLVPLVKNLQLKRIKINIIEKVTYTSKSPKDTKLAEETKNSRNRSRETVTTLMEIKTKDKPSSNINPRSVPQKTEIVSNCVNDNLLTFCYNNEQSNSFSSTHLQTPSKTHTYSHSRSNSHGSSGSFKSSATGFLHSSKKMSRFLDNSFNGHNDGHSNKNENNQIQEDVVITNPVKLQCPLTFVANDDSKFISNVYENLCTGTSDFMGLRDGHDYTNHNHNIHNNDSMSIFSVNSNDRSENVLSDDDFAISKSPKRRTRNFSFSSNNDNINYGSGPKNHHHEINEHLNMNNSNNISMADNISSSLYKFLPDATFSNLKIRHRLQISFRISRPDTKITTTDNKPKMHHYEVVVDTPIVFVSPFCVPETMNLPSYDDAVKHGIFEMNRSLSQVELNSDNDMTSSDNSSEENTVFAPCSPLMSGSTMNSMGNTLSEGANTTDTTNIIGTSPLSLPKTDFMKEHFERRNSAVSNDKYARANGIDTTSLLSATLSRSRGRSNSIHMILSNQDMEKINTIDGLMGLTPPDTNRPPEYNELGFKFERLKNENEEVDENIPPPPIYEEAITAKLETQNNTNISSNNSLRSERIGIFNHHNDTVDTNVHYRGVDSSNGNLRLIRDRNMSIESDFNGAVDTDSVMGDIASLNLTPTMNDR